MNTKNWNGTKVKFNDDFYIEKGVESDSIVTLNGSCIAEFSSEEDASIFYDALLIAQDGVEPKELLKQLNDAIKLIKDHTENGTGYTITQDDINPMLSFLTKMQIEQ